MPPITLDDKDWDTLLKRIKAGKCTPFLGAGASVPTLPLASEIAQKWADKYHYPLDDSDDLAQVTQFLAVERDDNVFPKDLFREQYKNITPPDFKASDEPHGLMADLPLPVYITTNYDNFMVQALKSRNKDPKWKLCRWNEYIKTQNANFQSEFDSDPTPANPIVFHLHGHIDVPESLVLTEDDYWDFLVNVSRDPSLLPPHIQKAMTGASLLFIGYRLADWSFRVLFRGLITSMEDSLRRINVAVQLPPGDQKGLTYLTKYFKNIKVLVYWGEAKEFAVELRQRAAAEGII